MTPAAVACRKGSVRTLVIGYARRLGFHVADSETLLASASFVAPGETNLAPHCVPMSAEFVTTLFQVIDLARWDELNRVFTDEITYYRPGYEPLVGYQRVEKFYREERVIASGTHILEGVMVDDERGACWGRFVGTHKNGSEIDEQFADTYIFVKGKIQRRKTYFFRPAV